MTPLGELLLIVLTPSLAYGAFCGLLYVIRTVDDARQKRAEGDPLEHLWRWPE